MKHLARHILPVLCRLFAVVPMTMAADPAPNPAAVPADGTTVWELKLPPNGAPVKAVFI